MFPAPFVPLIVLFTQSVVKKLLGTSPSSLQRQEASLQLSLTPQPDTRRRDELSAQQQQITHTFSISVQLKWALATGKCQDSLFTVVVPSQGREGRPGMSAMDLCRSQMHVSLPLE